MSTLSKKIYAYIALALGTAWQFRYLPSLSPDGRTMAWLAVVVFDLVVVILLTFAATIQPAEDGIKVEQFGTYRLSFTDVLRCSIVPFFPQTFVLVRTNRRFPLNILFCPLELNIDLRGRVEMVKLIDFLRSHNPRLGT